MRSIASRALRRIEGVDLAEVNAVTGQVLVAFSEDRVDVADLVDAAVEQHAPTEHRKGAPA